MDLEGVGKAPPPSTGGRGSWMVSLHLACVLVGVRWSNIVNPSPCGIKGRVQPPPPPTSLPASVLRWFRGTLTARMASTIVAGDFAPGLEISGLQGRSRDTKYQSHNGGGCVMMGRENHRLKLWRIMRPTLYG